METIKVNMTPNPLDVQTIHASQNDTEARQWEFELHNNGELIDTSDVTEQLVFKAYKGGTEQLLPENGSTPTTSPFLGDIRYPQGLLTDQEFTYRQSPTESDGLAKITDIKGNTLVWNQLVQNGNFADTNGWNATRGTIATSNNILSYTSTAIGGGATQNRLEHNLPVILANHKIFVRMRVKPAHATRCVIQVAVNGAKVSVGQISVNGNAWNDISLLYTLPYALDSSSNLWFGCEETSSNGYVIGDVDQYMNVMISDLTQMGLDITDPSDFTSLFPLSYYSYNQGSLLSFNGSGIKTVGRNILDLSSEFNRLGVNYTIDDDGWYTVSNVSNPNLYTSRLLLPKKLTNGSVRIVVNNAETTVQNFAVRLFNGTTVVAQTQDYFENEEFDRLGFNWSGSGSQASFKLMVVDSPTIGSYEPYTSSTLSLPISTYFPSGMKSAGNVYDELTESNAITRIGSVDLGSLTWTYDSTYNRFNTALTSSKISSSPRTNPNLVCPLYQTISDGRSVGNVPNMAIYQGSNYDLSVHNTSYTNANDFKQAMSGVYLYYELATPTETSFTTASLVTENAEIPLSNNDGTLIGKCTEELSENPGFIDAKIKLSDSDGECYSNKIQLHVERKPS